MANLIPQFAKKKVTTEYWFRVVTAWFMLWGVALLIATVLLFPVYIFTSVQIGVNAESARSAEASVANFESSVFDLEKASLQARYLIEDERRNKAHAFVDLIEVNEVAGVDISRITFRTSEDGTQPIIVGGQAADRQSLASFRDRLLADPAISSADLPISNLAKESDIDFSITVTMVKGVTL